MHACLHSHHGSMCLQISFRDFENSHRLYLWSFSDVTPPKFSNCPMMPIYVDEMEAVSYVAPTATDNSGLVKNVTVMPYNFKSGTVISGDVNVTYTAVDNSGNSDSCTIYFKIKGKV